MATEEQAGEPANEIRAGGQGGEGGAVSTSGAIGAVERVDAASVLAGATPAQLQALRARLRGSEPLARWLRGQMRRPGKFLASVTRDGARGWALASESTAAGCPSARVLSMAPEGEDAGEMAALALQEPGAFVGLEMSKAAVAAVPATASTRGLFD